MKWIKMEKQRQKDFKRKLRDQRGADENTKIIF